MKDNGDTTRKSTRPVISNNSVIESLVSGSLGSAFTTVLYQPLELIKTRIQLQKCASSKTNYIGISTESARNLVREHGVTYLWRGTAASLVRSVPGVGLYYSFLNVLQTNFSGQSYKPDSSIQAFYFGLVARSFVSLLMIPVSVVKVRYESGKYKYLSLTSALRDAYLNNGWVGISPTILRDSLFSGIYYMTYIELKHRYSTEPFDCSNVTQSNTYLRKFSFGIVSGLVASILTNPLDVIKTNLQITAGGKTMWQTATEVTKGTGGYRRLFAGLVPRSLRRTLVAATTWTFYEIITDNFKV